MASKGKWIAKGAASPSTPSHSNSSSKSQEAQQQSPSSQTSTPSTPPHKQENNEHKQYTYKSTPQSDIHHHHPSSKATVINTRASPDDQHASQSVNDHQHLQQQHQPQQQPHLNPKKNTRAEKEKRRLKQDELDKQEKQRQLQAEEEAKKIKEQQRLEAELAEKQRLALLQSEKEAEQQRIEAELAAKAAEEAAKEKEKQNRAAQLKYEEEQKIFHERQQLRDANLLITSRRSAASGGSASTSLPAGLDTSIKKCTGFLRKLKSLPDHSVSALTTECQSLNLSKYVSEVVVALCEAVIKKREDIDKIIRISSIMHARHDTFMPQMNEVMMKAFGDVKGKSGGGGGAGANKKTNPALANLTLSSSLTSNSGSSTADSTSASTTASNQSDDESVEKKKRSSLRLLTELYFTGLFDDTRFILDVLADTMQKDRHSTAQTLPALQTQACTYPQLNLLVSFLRYAGEEFCGITPKKYKEMLQTLSTSTSAASNTTSASTSTTLVPTVGAWVQQEYRDKCKHMFTQYLSLISSRYITLSTELNKKDKKIYKLTIMRGEVAEDITKERKHLHENHERLQQLYATLCDLLDTEMAVVPEVNTADEDEQMMLEVVSLSTLATSGQSPYEDEETKAFYQQLLDLTLVVPPILLREGNDKEKAQIRRAKQEGGTAAVNAEEEEEEEEDNKDKNSTPTAAVAIGAAPPTAAASPTASAAEPAKRDTTSGKRKRGRDDLSEELSIEELEQKLAEIKESRADEDTYYDDYPSSSQPRGSHPLDSLFQTLSSAFSREAVDSFASKFAYFNTKANRNRLITHLLRLPRSALDRLPFMARLVATLTQYHPDFGESLCLELMEEFYRLFKQREERRLDWKIKNIRFLAELVKFNVCTHVWIFRCWKACLLSLSHHSIQTMASMLDVCGYYLYHTPETHLRTLSYLEQMKRIKENVTFNHDKQLMLLIDNAYFTCHPDVLAAANQGKNTQKQRHPLELYIRRLIGVELNAKMVEKILKKMKKLPWHAPPPPLPAPVAPEGNTELASSAVSKTAGESVSEKTEEASKDGSATASTAAATPSVAPPPVQPYIPSLIVKLLTSPHLVKYSALNSLASLASGLTHDHPSLLQPLIDRICEEIRVGLEQNHYTQQQTRLTTIRYFAALFLYCVIDIPLLLDTLYLLLFFPATEFDSFRLRLILTLVEAVAPFFSTTQKHWKRKFERYLLYLLRSILLKEFIAFDVEMMMREVLDRVKPSYMKKWGFTEINAEIQRLEQEETRQGIHMEYRKQTAPNSDATNVPSSSPSASAATSRVHESKEPVVVVTSDAMNVEEEEGEYEENEEDVDLEEEEVDGEEEDESVGADADEGEEGPEDGEEAEDDEAEEEEGEEGLEEDGEGEEEAGEEEEDDEEDEDEEDDVWNRRRRVVASADDIAFDRELERLMAESLEARKHEVRHSQPTLGAVESLTFSHGLVDKKHGIQITKKKPLASSISGNSATGEEDDADAAATEHVVFKLLTRNVKRSALLVKEVLVPIDTELALSSVANEAAAKQERDDMKKLTIQQLQRSGSREDEDNQQQLQQQQQQSSPSYSQYNRKTGTQANRRAAWQSRDYGGAGEDDEDEDDERGAEDDRRPHHPQQKNDVDSLFASRTRGNTYPQSSQQQQQQQPQQQQQYNQTRQNRGSTGKERDRDRDPQDIRSRNRQQQQAPSSSSSSSPSSSSSSQGSQQQRQQQNPSSGGKPPQATGRSVVTRSTYSTSRTRLGALNLDSLSDIATNR